MAVSRVRKICLVTNETISINKSLILENKVSAAFMFSTHFHFKLIKVKLSCSGNFPKPLSLRKTNPCEILTWAKGSFSNCCTHRKQTKHMTWTEHEKA